MDFLAKSWLARKASFKRRSRIAGPKLAQDLYLAAET